MPSALLFRVSQEPVQVDQGKLAGLLGDYPERMPLGEGLQLFYIDGAQHWAPPNRTLGDFLVFGDFAVAREDGDDLSRADWYTVLAMLGR